jgi:hypothetical protein
MREKIKENMNQKKGWLSAREPLNRRFAPFDIGLKDNLLYL